MPGPLDGVKVLEFTEIIAGPFCGMLLADMGADIIKVEPPWGEPWRIIQQVIPNEGRQYMSLNRGKRCLTLNLKRPEAREVVYRLLPDMDVVLINARPDVPKSLGIDYETLSAMNPGLIYCSNTAFGTDGPWSLMPGYDIVAQGVTGLMTSEAKLKDDGTPEQIVSTPLADYSTGIAMAWGVSAALYHRERTGRGQKIETSLLGSALAVQGGRFIEVDALDKEDARRVPRRPRHTARVRSKLSGPARSSPHAAMGGSVTVLSYIPGRRRRARRRLPRQPPADAHGRGPGPGRPDTRPGLRPVDGGSPRRRGGRVRAGQRPCSLRRRSTSGCPYSEAPGCPRGRSSSSRSCCTIRRCWPTTSCLRWSTRSWATTRRWVRSSTCPTRR